MLCAGRDLRCPLAARKYQHGCSRMKRHDFAEINAVLALLPRTIARMREERILPAVIMLLVWNVLHGDGKFVKRRSKRIST